MERSRKTQSLILFTVIFVLITPFLSTVYATPGTWTTRDYLGASATHIRDIDGGNLVGNYSDVSGYHGFVYNGTSWTTLDYQGEFIEIQGISGNNIVGYHTVAPGHIQGLLYDGTDWTTLDEMPGARMVYINGIDGSNIVGRYEDDFPSDYLGHGFLYDGSDWLTLDAPGAIETRVEGIDGSNLVGVYGDASGYHGFLYDGTNWTALDAPGADWTEIYGIDGSNLVGTYGDASGSHGFLYDGTSWSTLDMPEAYETWIYGIDGSNLVGSYSDASGTHGFIYEIPEPVTVFLLGFGILLARKRRIR